jgi:sodium-independent sulfate anion transporter 11
VLLTAVDCVVVNMHRREHPRFKLLGSVPRGFKHMNVPTLTHDLVRDIAPELPGAIIVLLIEHIAISKSFGRVKCVQQPSHTHRLVRILTGGK